MIHTDIVPRMNARRVHAYAASFGEDLASDLIANHTTTGDFVLDPFAGGGTALLQARLLGRNAIGIDVDPVACLIARVTATSYSLEEIDRLHRTVTRELSIIESELSSPMWSQASWEPGARFSIGRFTCKIPENRQIEFWFAPVQRALISVLVELATSTGDSRLRDIVELAISSAVIRKWPNTLSLARDLDHSRPHRVLRDDLTVSSQIGIFLRVFRAILQALRAINVLPQCHIVSPRVIEGDCVGALHTLRTNSVDYVLTSPPYFNAIDYPRAHRFSQWWLRPDADNLRRISYIGLRPGGEDKSVIQSCLAAAPSSMSEVLSLQTASHSLYEALCRYVVDMDAVIRGLVRVLKPGKMITLVLANNCIRRISVPVVDIVAEILERHGFTAISNEKREIRTNRRRYPYGLKGFRGLMNSEYILYGRKPLP